MDISELLAFTFQQQGSDLHVSAGEAPMIRVHGSMKKVKAEALSSEETQKMLYDIMNDAQRKIFEEKSDIFFNYKISIFLISKSSLQKD